MLDVRSEFLLVLNPIEELLITTNRPAQACEACRAADDVQRVAVPEDDGRLTQVGACRRLQRDATLALAIAVAPAGAAGVEAASSGRRDSVRKSVVLMRWLLNISLRACFNNADDVVRRIVLVLEGCVIHVHLDLLILAVFEMESSMPAGSS
eukprot:CAMPEP_0117565770 /NCGR_PEP_ID=MMETSP0784-20121206/56745_1 /TAXON_ID=39447 /ORGANISM="" /LENGTH=151 /DNA_ID=CAMNT_0005363585 /DNA_START=848 /DNA_END=1300 /DNA_ORIENTATION=-